MDTKRTANLDRAFNPRVIAVVGDKKSSDYMWLRSVRDTKAKIYSVQIDENEIPGILEMGVPNYRSLKEVPEPAIDYVISAVPRQIAPRIVQDCIDLNVGALAFFTSGFAETGEELGIRLQDQLTRMCRESGLNLVGPNCMCLYHAAAGIRTGGGDQWIGPDGNVSFLSNSGTHTGQFIARAHAAGLIPNKAASMGNAIGVDQADWLEYLGQDPTTEAIGMYVEGVRNGRRFFEVLRDVAPRKPVVIWKGGQNPEGARAAASHTGHLASPMALWDAMIRQTGALRADSPDEAIDILKGLLLMKPTTGERMGIIAQTGGQSVLVSDSMGREGLKVPLLEETTYEKLRPIVTLVGGSWRNPLDVSGSLTGIERGREMLEALARDSNVDIVLMEVNVGFLGRRLQRQGQGVEDLVRALQEFKESTPKPFAVVSPWNPDEAAAVQARTRLGEGGIPAFISFQAAARAIRRVVDFHRARTARANGD